MEELNSITEAIEDIKKGKIVTKTNNSGGILGGISNGMPITIRIAFKPASSIAQKQSTVDIKTKKIIYLNFITYLQYFIFIFIF